MVDAEVLIGNTQTNLVIVNYPDPSCVSNHDHWELLKDLPWLMKAFRGSSTLIPISDSCTLD